jgi:hypothetical protein
VFLGANINWAQYILEHRAHLHEDPCQDDSHGSVISGPMADNRTAKIIGKYAFQYLKGNHHIVEDFYSKITQTEFRKKLDGLDLGNQIVFSNPEMANEVLSLVGYWKMTEAVWEYEDI